MAIFPNCKRFFHRSRRARGIFGWATSFQNVEFQKCSECFFAKRDADAVAAHGVFDGLIMPEDAVGAREVDFLGDLFLAAHGVEGDSSTFYVDLAQQIGQGGDFGGLPSTNNWPSVRPQTSAKR